MSWEERLGLGHVFNMYCWPKVKLLQTFTASKIIFQQVLINLTRKIFQKKGMRQKIPVLLGMISAPLCRVHDLPLIGNDMYMQKMTA